MVKSDQIRSRGTVFDTINHCVLWEILEKIACFDFVDISRKLHIDMKVLFNFNYVLLKPIAIDAGVKQRDTLFPTNSGVAHKGCDVEVCVFDHLEMFSICAV